MTLNRLTAYAAFAFMAYLGIQIVAGFIASGF